MKSIITFFLFIGSCMSIVAQEDSNSRNMEKPYNRWSIEFGFGQNKPIRPFSEGYYSSNPNRYFNLGMLNHYDLGVRYMFNPKFGLKMDLGYDRVKNQTQGGSLLFDNRQYRIGLQGVVNLSRVLNFETFTNRLGLLAHAGVQVSQLSPQLGINKGKTEDNGGIILGLSPQYRLGNHFAIYGDFSVLSNVRQHFNWDGAYSAINNNLTGLMYTMSLGVSCYLGKKTHHADWVVENDVQEIKKNTEKVNKRLESIETRVSDVDQDGVPDYLDVENNTPKGVAVDSHGRSKDANNNGVNDDLERIVEEVKNEKQVQKEVQVTGSTISSELIKEGFVNIFYDVNQYMPNPSSLNNVHYVIQYLKKNPKSKARLVGYADMRGDESKNKDLSKRRAVKLMNFIISSGIDMSRVSCAGEGVDRTYLGEDKIGLDLARRVTIILE